MENRVYILTKEQSDKVALAYLKNIEERCNLCNIDGIGICGICSMGLCRDHLDIISNEPFGAPIFEWAILCKECFRDFVKTFP